MLLQDSNVVMLSQKHHMTWLVIHMKLGSDEVMSAMENILQLL